jgi:hypothetical protein
VCLCVARLGLGLKHDAGVSMGFGEAVCELDPHHSPRAGLLRVREFTQVRLAAGFLVFGLLLCFGVVLLLGRWGVWAL